MASLIHNDLTAQTDTEEFNLIGEQGQKAERRVGAFSPERRMRE